MADTDKPTTDAPAAEATETSGETAPEMTPESVAAAAADKPERPKRATDEEILARPPPAKVPEPNRDERDAKMDKLHAEMGNIKQRLEDIRRQLEKQHESKGENKEAIDAAHGKFQNMKEALKMKREELDKVQAQLDKASQAHKNLVGAMKEMEKKLSFTSSAKIDDRINELETKISTQSLGAREERELVAEINKLKASKNSVKEYDMHKEAIDKVKADRDRLNDVFKTKLGEVKDLKKVVDKYRGEWTELRDAHRASGSELYKQLTGERDKLRKRRDALWEESKKVKEEFNTANRAFRQYRREMDDIKFAKRRQERAAYEAERKAREDEEAKEYAEMDPWANHKFAVQALLGFLAKYAPKETSGDASAKAAQANDANKDGAPKHADDAVAKRNDFSGMVALQKKDVEYFAPSKGAKKNNNRGNNKAGNNNNNNKAGKAAAIPLDPEILSSFAMLEIPVPKTVEDVPAAIKALKEKQEWMKTAPAPEKKAKEPAAAKASGDDAAGSEVTAKKPAAKQQKQKAPKIDSTESFPTLPGATSTPSQPVVAGAWS